MSLRQLCDLWKEVSNLAGALGLPLMMATSAPSPVQLYGIETNEYAHELAQATIWIGYIHWLRENGYGLPPGQEPHDNPRVQAIAVAARELDEKWQRWLHPDGVGVAELKKRTLTNLYNQRPTWLQLAHEQLDRAVLDAYGWPHDLGDGRPTNEEILRRLLEENLRRGG